MKKIPRLRISEAHLSDIENKLTTVYETNKLDLNEQSNVQNDKNDKIDLILYLNNEENWN